MDKRKKRYRARMGLFRPKGSRKTRALTKEQFDFVVEAFRRRGDYRMEAICLLMGRCLRIGDVLRTLKIQDIFTQSGEARDTICLREEKTGKSKSFHTQNSTRLREVLADYYKTTLNNLPKDGPIFFGEKTGRPLTDQGVKFLLSEFIGERGIEQCSPHSFRKFGAKYLWTQGVEIETISEVLNHHSVKETRTYLDIQRKEVESAMAMLEV
jgi:site-specific recombinase XerD